MKLIGGIVPCNSNEMLGEVLDLGWKIASEQNFDRQLIDRCVVAVSKSILNRGKYLCNESRGNYRQGIELYY